MTQQNFLSLSFVLFAEEAKLSSSLQFADCIECWLHHKIDPTFNQNRLKSKPHCIENGVCVSETAVYIVTIPAKNLAFDKFRPHLMTSYTRLANFLHLPEHRHCACFGIQYTPIKNAMNYLGHTNCKIFFCTTPLLLKNRFYRFYESLMNNSAPLLLHLMPLQQKSSKLHSKKQFTEFLELTLGTYP